jgi:hypothetical protein
MNEKQNVFKTHSEENLYNITIGLKVKSKQFIK